MPRASAGCCGPSLFTTAAFILSQIASKGCYYLRLSDDNWLRDVSWGGWVIPRSIAVWCYEAEGGNWYRWPDNANFDSKFDAARGMAVTTTVIGFIAWVYFLVAACLPFPPTLFVCMGFLLVLNCLFEGLTFLVYKSDFCDPPDGLSGSCSLDTGGKCGIAACVLWFVAGLMSCAAAKDAGGDRGGDDEGEREAPKEEADAEEGGAAEEAGGDD